MEREYKKNKTTEFLHKLDKLILFCSGINFWVDDSGIPDLVLKAYKKMTKVHTVLIILLLAAEFGGFFTQHNLTDKQKSDRIMITFSHTIMYWFTFSVIQHKETLTELLFALAVVLKKDFNDEETESHMLKQNKIYLSALLGLCFGAVVTYGLDGLTQVLFSDGNFVTVITVWPDIHDQSFAASIARVFYYVIWWLWMTRVSTSYLLVLTVTIGLSHQYKNLQLYFRSIEGIFEERISQRDKERKFERALKLGVRLHATTIWCTEQVQKTCGDLFTGHLTVNLYALVLLMSQLATSDRSMSHLLSIGVTILSLLISTGVIMWSAGDVTIEADNLPTAVFQSGWHHCQNTSAFRIRRLVLITLAQSQKPVIITSWGFVGLSYESYVSIVKMSYSIFSVMY